MRRVIRACVEFGVKYMTIYAFSTENWGRPKDEVDGLLILMENVIDNELEELNGEGVQICGILGTWMGLHRVYEPRWNSH